MIKKKVEFLTKLRIPKKYLIKIIRPIRRKLVNYLMKILRRKLPLPSVDYTLGKIGNSKIFSKIDANSAFGKENYQMNQNCSPHS